MQNTPHIYQSIPHISQHKLAEFPGGYIAVFCCRRDQKLIPVSELLEEFGHLTVAETVERLADAICPQCGKDAKSVFLQDNISRKPSARREHHGAYAKIR